MSSPQLDPVGGILRKAADPINMEAKATTASTEQSSGSYFGRVFSLFAAKPEEAKEAEAIFKQIEQAIPASATVMGNAKQDASPLKQKAVIIDPDAKSWYTSIVTLGGLIGGSAPAAEAPPPPPPPQSAKPAAAQPPAKPPRPAKLKKAETPAPQAGPVKLVMPAGGVKLKKTQTAAPKAATSNVDPQLAAILARRKQLNGE